MRSKKTITKSEPYLSHVSFVHDFFWIWGGAESVIDALTQALPNNTIYAAIDHKEIRHKPLDTVNVETTFIQKLPFTRTRLLELYKFLFPLAFERLQFKKDTKLIFSDTAAFAKFIIPPEGIKHISYIHTPPRFLWGLPPSKKVRSNNFLRYWWNFLFGTSFRIADFLHANRVHALIANSQETALRIRKFYRREPIAIVNAPVYVKKFAKMVNTGEIEIKKEFLVFGRIERYKNVEALVKIWPKGYKLTISGVGTQAEEIKKMVANNPEITFLNEYVPDDIKPQMFASFSGFLYPAIEDFGIMMVEAIAVGTPVIGQRAGGGGEIVDHKKTGYLLDDLTQTELKAALDWCLQFQRSKTQKDSFYKLMLKYDIEAFINKIREIATKYMR